MTCDEQSRDFVAHQSDFATVGDPNESLSQLPAARYDYWATVRADGTTIDSAMVERDVESSTEGPAAVTFDVDTDTFDTTDFSVEIDGAADDDTLEWGAYLWSTRRTLVNLAQPAEYTYAGIPTSALEDNDVHQVVADAVNGESTSLRATWSYSIDPGNVTLALPSAFGDASVEAADTTPYVRFQASLDAWEGATLYELQISQTDRTLYWEATDGWLGDADSYSWEQPDLGDLDGWTNGWALADNVESTWFAGAHRSSIDPRRFDEPSPPADLDGVTRDLVRVLGTTTP
jgi:hypothetical protein